MLTFRAYVSKWFGIALLVHLQLYHPLAHELVMRLASEPSLGDRRHCKMLHDTTMCSSRLHGRPRWSCHDASPSGRLQLLCGLHIWIRKERRGEQETGRMLPCPSTILDCCCCVVRRMASIISFLWLLSCATACAWRSSDCVSRHQWYIRCSRPAYSAGWPCLQTVLETHWSTHSETHRRNFGLRCHPDCRHARAVWLVRGDGDRLS